MGEKIELHFNHKVLIVDDEELVGKSIGKMLDRHQIDYTYINTGEKAIDLIEEGKEPFSLIISDQRMPDMTGIQFLEQARKIIPETIRFLITGFTKMEVIVNAVNKGSIHRYIEKSWDSDDLIKIIKSGLKQFEVYLKNEELESQSKDQNKKLKDLNAKLKKAEKQHKEFVHKLDKKTQLLKKQVVENIKNNNSGMTLKKVEKLFAENDLLENDKINGFYTDVIREIYEQFCKTAKKNGFNLSYI
ncbi:MAG: response regulator [Desulfobacteraceae bacterium]|nr:response regulator [Desulfobacteraceae bacterium]